MSALHEAENARASLPDVGRRHRGRVARRPPTNIDLARISSTDGGISAATHNLMLSRFSPCSLAE
jgi:hypothetical protein